MWIFIVLNLHFMFSHPRICRKILPQSNFFVLLPFHIFCTSFWNNSYIEALAIQHYTHFFKFNRVVFIDKKRYTATFSIYFNVDFLANKKRLSWEWKTSPNIDFCMFQEFPICLNNTYYENIRFILLCLLCHLLVFLTRVQII